MNSESRFWVTVAAGLSLAIAGCGGGKPPAGNPAGAPVMPANVPPANPPPGQVRPGPAQPVAGNATTNASGEAESEPGEPDPDQFELNTDQTVLELAGTFQPPPSPAVEVVPLPAGQNSTTLEIVSDSSDPAAANISLQPAAPPVEAAATKKASTKTSRGAAKEALEVTAAGWQIPAGITPVAGSGIHAETGLPLRITMERDAVEMVLIPPGVFLEGVDGQDPQAGPQHSVLLETPYYIDVTEVTVARYDAFRDFLRKSENRRLDPAANHDGNPELPAVGIKFLDAKYFAKWAGKELPTEAQWERAGRGTQGFNYPWGDGRPIWQRGRQPGQLDPVATFHGDLSPDGVYDMAGNAREWCLDLFSPDIYQKDVATGGAAVRNPVNVKFAPGVKLQVVRGSQTDWAVWHRAGHPQAETAPDIGFRCVLNITAEPKEAEKATKGSDKRKKPVAF